MDKNTNNSLKSLYLSFFIVGTFIVLSIAMQLPKVNSDVSMSDRALAGSEEAIETTIPIGGSDEATILPISSTIPSTSPTARPTFQPTTSPTATPSAIPTSTIEPTLAPVESSTPVPTFDLNLPGDTSGSVPTNPPVAQTQESNNLPIVIGVIVGVLLIAGGVILVLVKRKSQNIDLPPTTIPPQTPPVYPPASNQPIDQSGFNTPYDQYVNTQPKQPENPQQ